MTTVRQLAAPVAALLDAAADRHGVPRGLARAVAWIESRGNAFAASPKGAIGIMQLMPATASALGVDPHDPAQNVDGGVRYLARLIKTHGGDVQAALASYNWGPGNVQKHATWPTSVVKYVQDVLSRASIEGFRVAAIPLAPTPAAPAAHSPSSPASRSPRSRSDGGDDEP